MRLLHLIQPLAPRASWLGADSRDHTHAANQVSGEASLHALRAILADRSMPAEHFVLCLGPTPAREHVRSAQLAGVLHASPPLGRAANAGVMLRRTLRRIGRLDAIVGWGWAAQGLFAKAPHDLRPRCCVLDPRTGRLSRAFGGALAAGAIDLPAPELTPLAGGAGGGGAGDTIAAHRDAARRRLAIGPHETVAMMLGDAAIPPDAVALTLAAQSHAVTGRMLTLVLPACAARLDRALRHVHEMAYLHRVIVHDGPLVGVLAAGDVGVLAPADASQANFSGAIWARLWRAATAAPPIAPPIAPLVAPEGLLPASIPFQPARSTRATDVASGIFAALTTAAPPPPVAGPVPIPPGAALLRALQHVLAMPAAMANAQTPPNPATAPTPTSAPTSASPAGTTDSVA
jgi:hypothetical protein